MLKLPITYKNLDDVEVTDEYHFNITTSEAMEMNWSHKGGLEEHVKMIIAEEDMGKLIELFKELILKAVGKRSPDGRRFVKNQENTDDLTQTGAYSVLFMRLATDANFAQEFLNGIMPSELRDAVQKKQQEDAAGTTNLPAVSDTAEPAWLTEGRAPTPDELRGATPAQLQKAIQLKYSAAPSPLPETPGA